jgi:hypothetical protein
MTLWFTNKQGWENALWWEIGLICLQSLLAGGLAYRFRSVPISFYFLAIAGILEIGLALKMLT